MAAKGKKTAPAASSPAPKTDEPMVRLVCLTCRRREEAAGREAVVLALKLLGMYALGIYVGYNLFVAEHA